MKQIKKIKKNRWKWSNVVSGCGSTKGLIFHITTVLGAKRTRLFLWRLSQGFFWLPGKQTTVTEKSVFPPGSVRLSVFQNKVGDSFSLGWAKRRKRRRAGPRMWFEVILSHEGTSSGKSYMLRSNLARRLLCRGEKHWVTHKYDHITVSWVSFQLTPSVHTECFQTKRCVLLTSNSKYDFSMSLKVNLRITTEAWLRSYDFFHEIIVFCLCYTTAAVVQSCEMAP